MEPLAEYLLGAYSCPEGAETGEPEKAQFVIDSLDKASWALRKIAQMQEKKAAAIEQADIEFRRVSAWRDEQVAAHDKQIAFFEFLLRPFAEQSLDGEKKRSLKLPAGTMGFRAGQPHYDVNEPELLAYVKASAPEFLKIKESVDWPRFKKDMGLRVDGNRAVTKEGEIIPGIVASEGEDTFFVKVGE